jgi:hypothetical protein
MRPVDPEDTMTASTPVTHRRVAEIAAKAGVTDLRTDGPGRYFTGETLIVREGSSYHVYSPINSDYAPRTLEAALEVAVQLNADEAEMTAKAKAMTDDQLREALRTPGLEYHLRQRVIAEQCSRTYRAEKQLIAAIEHASDEQVQAKADELRAAGCTGNGGDLLWIVLRLQHFRAGRVDSWIDR